MRNMGSCWQRWILNGLAAGWFGLEKSVENFDFFCGVQLRLAGAGCGENKIINMKQQRG